MSYKSKDLQSIFGKSQETIRTWAEEFQQYLSPLAVPGRGQHRLFSDDDLSVFALVNELKNAGRTYEDAHAALKAGQRGDIPAQTVDRALALENSLALDIAQRQLAVLEAERDEARQEARRLHDEVIKLRTQLDEREKVGNDLREAQSKIEALQREIGGLEAMLNMLKEKGE